MYPSSWGRGMAGSVTLSLSLCIFMSVLCVWCESECVMSYENWSLHQHRTTLICFLRKRERESVTQSESVKDLACFFSWMRTRLREWESLELSEQKVTIFFITVVCISVSLENTWDWGGIFGGFSKEKKVKKTKQGESESHICRRVKFEKRNFLSFSPTGQLKEAEWQEWFARISQWREMNERNGKVRECTTDLKRLSRWRRERGSSPRAHISLFWYWSQVYVCPCQSVSPEVLMGWGLKWRDQKERNSNNLLKERCVGIPHLFFFSLRFHLIAVIFHNTIHSRLSLSFQHITCVTEWKTANPSSSHHLSKGWWDDEKKVRG